MAVRLDAQDYASVVEMADAVVARFGHIDILVNSIAGGATYPPEDFPPEEWNRSIHANLNAVFYLCQVVGRQMLKQGKGSIINIASMYGVVAPYKHIYEGTEMPRNPIAYGVAKAGIIQMTRYLAILRGPTAGCASTASARAASGQKGKQPVFERNYNKMSPDGRSGNDWDLKGLSSTWRATPRPHDRAQPASGRRLDVVVATSGAREDHVMNTRRLGRTGLQVSEIGLGTVELGLDYGVPVAGEHLRPPEENAARLLNRALDLGVNFIDTARAYGASEEVIGRALKSRRGTNTSWPPSSRRSPTRATDGELREAGRGFHRREPARCCRRDVIDVLQLHSAPVEVIRRGRVVEAIQEAQRAGHVPFHRRHHLRRGSCRWLRWKRAATTRSRLPTTWPIGTLEEQVLPLAQAKGRGHCRALGAAARGADPSLQPAPGPAGRAADGDRAVGRPGRMRKRAACRRWPIASCWPTPRSPRALVGTARSTSWKPPWRSPARGHCRPRWCGHSSCHGQRPKTAQPRHLAG